jgi:hypothetical protein
MQMQFNDYEINNGTEKDKRYDDVLTVHNNKTIQKHENQSITSSSQLQYNDSKLSPFFPPVSQMKLIP